VVVVVECREEVEVDETPEEEFVGPIEYTTAAPATEETAIIAMIASTVFGPGRLPSLPTNPAADWTATSRFMGARARALL
jgi:hypothetical protein